MALGCSGPFITRNPSQLNFEPKWGHYSELNRRLGGILDNTRTVSWKFMSQRNSFIFTTRPTERAIARPGGQKKRLLETTRSPQPVAIPQGRVRLISFRAVKGHGTARCIRLYCGYLAPCEGGLLWTASFEKLCVAGSLCVLLCNKWRVLSSKRRRIFMATRGEILGFQMWGRAYFVHSLFLVLTSEGGLNSGASNRIGPRNEILSYSLLTYTSC